jgi:hypothetical protein
MFTTESYRDQMSATQVVNQAAKYTYKFRMAPEEPKQQEADALDERQIQEYIDNLLGVDSKRYASKPSNANDISR